VLTKAFSVLRGVLQMRHPEAVRILGDLRRAAIEMQKVQASCPGAIIHADVVVQGWPNGELRLSKGVRVEKGCILALGDDFNGYGTVDVGADTWIGQYNNFRLSQGTHISIGKACLIAQFCTFVAANHRIERSIPIQQSPCDPNKSNIEIGDDVWIAAGAAIMPSVNIGTGAVIGANSVVTCSVPEYEIWAGAPARKIGERV
jgi:acetyltransferase-like isoleucine patch superfamily enzyme